MEVSAGERPGQSHLDFLSGAEGRGLFAAVGEFQALKGHGFSRAARSLKNILGFSP
jgi:hypothetical protein